MSTGPAVSADAHAVMTVVASVAMVIVSVAVLIMCASRKRRTSDYTTRQASMVPAVRRGAPFRLERNQMGIALYFEPELIDHASKNANRELFEQRYGDHLLVKLRGLEDLHDEVTNLLSAEGTAVKLDSRSGVALLVARRFRCQHRWATSPDEHFPIAVATALRRKAQKRLIALDSRFFVSDVHVAMSHRPPLELRRHEIFQLCRVKTVRLEAFV